MRVVHAMAELDYSFRAAQSEATSAFGDPRLYIEKYLEKPRHVEFQILADQHGNLIHLGERECSIQRRHQKVIEERPSVIVDDAMRTRMGATAVLAAKACGYQNAGTIEFLIDSNRNFYFLEMNTRLQVEHPITEMCTGVDIVAEQLRITAGERLSLSQHEVEFRGHAIECRIYAEDAANGFVPSTGTITHLRPPQGPGIREDRGIEEGATVSVYYDPLISKLVAWGNTRLEAIDRMKRALREYEILGVRTNIDANLFVLNHSQFINGDFDTHFFSTYFDPEQLAKPSASGRRAAAVVCALLHHRDRSAAVGASDGTGLVQNQGEHLSNHRPVARWKDQRVTNMRS
jgi:acetyl/propionyl-CoA carboxylase alpha subunit